MLQSISTLIHNHSLNQFCHSWKMQYASSLKQRCLYVVIKLKNSHSETICQHRKYRSNAKLRLGV